jgi:hypothetical protein
VEQAYSYIALHRSTISAAEFTTTDDPDSVLDNPESYSMCTLDVHRSALAIPDLKFDDPELEGPPTPNIAGISMPIPTIPYKISLALLRLSQHHHYTTPDSRHFWLHNPGTR